MAEKTTVEVQLKLPRALHTASKIAAASAASTLKDFCIEAITAYCRMTGEENSAVKKALEGSD